MSLEVLKAGSLCFFDELSIQFFITGNKRNVHKRTVFLTYGTLEKLAAVKEIIKNLSLFFVLSLHYFKTAHLLEPLEYLTANVSSCFLSEPVDVSKYAIIYGGVQKNIGPAGVVIVIIREDLITEDTLPGTPTMLKYKTHADNGSMYNTPPAYGIYVCGKVFKWLKKMGGLEVMKKRNEEKAKVLYDFLDSSKLFKGTVRKEDRSLMNVPFVTGDEELDAKFVKEAKAAGFENLKGHRSVGGMRASIYNAMPKEGVEALVEFMKKFEAENLK